MNNENEKYPCPCCGHLGFDKEPGSTDDICNNCYWHDDDFSLTYAHTACGPNKVSLIEAQKNFIEFEAKEFRLIEAAKKARKSITVNIEKDWRPINLKHDKFISYDSPDYPEDLTTLYYWRENYWLNN